MAAKKRRRKVRTSRRKKTSKKKTSKKKKTYLMGLRGDNGSVCILRYVKANNKKDATDKLFSKLRKEKWSSSLKG